MSTTIVLDQRFAGPPDSANGGYACGAVATALDAGGVEVTLRKPPPLDRDLTLAPAAAGVELRDDGELVARAQPAEPDLDLPAPVSLATARRAADGFDIEDYAARHHYPRCFTCGPDREPGDGLRIFPGYVPASTPTVAWPWVPDASLAADDGRIDPTILWAVLDCPSGLAWIHQPAPATSYVLGRMTARIERRPEPGEQLIAAGWALGEDGRKRFAGSAIWSDTGEVLAANQAIWIGLSEEQRATFKPVGDAT